MICIFIPVTGCISLLKYNTIYPFYYGWVWRMDPISGYYRYCCYEHTCSAFNEYLHISSAYIFRRWLVHMICKCSALVDTATQLFKMVSTITLPPVILRVLAALNPPNTSYCRALLIDVAQIT